MQSSAHGGAEILDKTASFIRTALKPANFACLTLGCVIAAVLPFDRGFIFLTGGYWYARVALLAVFALVGIALAPRLGTGVAMHDLRHPIVTTILIAIGVAIVLTFVDVELFRQVLPADYADSIQRTSTVDRLVHYMLRAFNEGIMYRLFLGTVLACLLGLFWRSAEGRPSGAAIMIAMVLAQTINTTLNLWLVPHTPLTLMMITYGAVRSIIPGALWGYLYWRYGLFTNDAAQMGTHLFFQPLLTFWFR